MLQELDEPVLEDDYPIHAGFNYVVDGEVTMALCSCTVEQLKRAMNAVEIRRCDMAGRNMFGRKK